MFKKKTTKPDLTQYNMYAIKAGYRTQAEGKMFDDPDAFERKRLENAGRNLELEEMEERLGIDGVRPSDHGKFQPNAITGTTSYSAFKKADIRVASDGEYELN